MLFRTFVPPTKDPRTYAPTSRKRFIDSSRDEYCPGHSQSTVQRNSSVLRLTKLDVGRDGPEACPASVHQHHAVKPAQPQIIGFKRSPVVLMNCRLHHQVET